MREGTGKTLTAINIIMAYLHNFASPPSSAHSLIGLPKPPSRPSGARIPLPRGPGAGAGATDDDDAESDDLNFIEDAGERDAVLACALAPGVSDTGLDAEAEATADEKVRKAAGRGWRGRVGEADPATSGCRSSSLSCTVPCRKARLVVCVLAISPVGWCSSVLPRHC